MEIIENRLLEAARKGSIISLQELLKEDPLILDRAVVNSFNETSLHVAAMLGHIDFVNKIIEIKPELVVELNSHKSSLHLASAKGHVDVVRALLSVDQRMCLVRDRNELTPLHLAAIKGRVEVMKVLLKAQPDAARLPVYGGGNILHLCVKRYQLEALKLLVETVDEPHELINSKDVDGNTVLHLAVADKQVETTKFLVSMSGVEVNAVNNEGMTAVDVLIRSRRDVRDSEIEKTLKQARGFGTSETNMPALNMNQNMRRWDGQQKIALTFVAILIAITAFQIGVKSASVVWQDDGLASSDLHRAGFSILTEKKIPKGFRRFCIANATSFAASLSIILLLICGLPFIRRFFMWILMVIAKIAITVVVCYVFVIVVVTPNSYQEQTVLFEVVCTVIVWLIFMALLFIRMVVNFVEKLRSPAAPLQENDIIVV